MAIASKVTKRVTKDVLEQEWKKQTLAQLTNMQEQLDSISKSIETIIKYIKSDKLDIKHK